MLTADQIAAVGNKVFKTVDIDGLGQKFHGKVRDYYSHNGKRILVTTDRISAFDKVLGYIPYKGQVLNQLSAFWFEKTKHIIGNHIIDIPHPNVSIVKEVKPYPVEMVVRGYISGVTKTSLWYAYSQGERNIYGIRMPDGLSKNEKLPKPVITPTTKAEYGGHDEKLTHDEIINRKLLGEKLLEHLEEASIALYMKGAEICRKQGLILVDTKYEFGEYEGHSVLIDEIHTPDSSRFWKEANYEQKFSQGEEPENFDKEFFRIWYVQKGYRGDGEPPDMPQELQVKTADRYIKIYEMITGKQFTPGSYPLERSVIMSVKKYFHLH